MPKRPRPASVLALEDLPVEVALRIVRHLPDVKSVLSLARVDRRHHALVLGDGGAPPSSTVIPVKKKRGGCVLINHSPANGLVEFLCLTSLARTPQAWLLRQLPATTPAATLDTNRAWGVLIREGEWVLRQDFAEHTTSDFHGPLRRLLAMGSLHYTERFLALPPLLTDSKFYNCCRYQIFLLQPIAYLFELNRVALRQETPRSPTDKVKKPRQRNEVAHSLHIAIVTYLDDCHALSDTLRRAMRDRVQGFLDMADAKGQPFDLDYGVLLSYLFWDREHGIVASRGRYLESFQREGWLWDRARPREGQTRQHIASSALYLALIYATVMCKMEEDGDETTTALVRAFCLGSFGLDRQLLVEVLHQLPSSIHPSEYRCKPVSWLSGDISGEQSPRKYYIGGLAVYRCYDPDWLDDLYDVGPRRYAKFYAQLYEGLGLCPRVTNVESGPLPTWVQAYKK